MSHRKFVIGSFVLYMVLMTALMVWQGIGIAPDRYALVLLLAALLVKRTRAFLLDWVPFLFILITYDFLRGFADNLSNRVHLVELINAEMAIFGTIPTADLQRSFFNPNSPAWYDYFATVIYFLHFALPLSFGFIIWVYNKSHFREFVVGILLLSYAAWATYIIYPAAPPWMAAEQGQLSGVTKVMDVTSRSFPTKIDLPTIYQKFNPNPVAAIPSLHAGYPMLFLLFSLKFFKKKALFFIPYVLAVWVAIVYLGEHYVIDVLLGALYAIVAFIITHLIYVHGSKINNKPPFKYLSLQNLPFFR